MTERRVAGRYHLLEPIGEGGMGVVWRAHDELLDRIVAVKEVRYRGVDEAERSDLNRRTVREARTAGRLDHPSVIIVHDVVEEDGQPWIVMQLVRSRSLGEVVRERGPLPPEQVAAVGLSVLGALRAAHAAGVLHRDVKPENVLLADDGRVVLTDFGIAATAHDTGITRTGGMVGTPAFLPPERLHGLPATPESDLWSLGATLYAALEGHRPFERATAAATMMAVLSGEPSPMTHTGPLATAVLGLMNRDPAMRMRADEAEALLVRAAGGTPPGAAAPPREPSRSAPPHAATPAPYGAQPGPTPPPAAAHPWPLPAQALQTHPGDPSHPGGWTGPGRRTRTGGAGSRMPAGGPGRRVALAVGAPLLVAVIGVGGWLLFQNRGEVRADPEITASATPQPDIPTPVPTATPSGRRIPKGWRLYRDPLGFSIAVPRGWTVQRSTDRRRVEFRKPGSAAFLWVESTEDPEKDPVKHWEKVEEGGTARNVWPGYERVAITPLTYQGRPAADWEFTYDRAGVRTHVLDRGFRTADDTPYAIYWESPEESWNPAFFDRFTETFRP
ncbi:serine/threonine-protein kinase [Planobispora rosea]|nr:serine/threonine-protein kinase [Planobispora rosea]